MEELKIKEVRKFFLKPEESFNKHVWIKKDGKDFMFKFFDEDTPFFYVHKRAEINDVFLSAMSKIVGVPYVSVQFARYKLWDKDGTLSESFLKKGEKEVNFHQISQFFVEKKLNDLFGEDFFENEIYPAFEKDFLKSKKESSKKEDWNTSKKLIFLQDVLLGEKSELPDKTKTKIKNSSKEIRALISSFNLNPTDIEVVETVHKYAKENNLQLDENFEEDFAKMLVFDFLTIQDDRNNTNISFVLNGKNLRLAPLFDSGNCLAYYTLNYDTSKVFNRTFNCIQTTNFLKERLDKKGEAYRTFSRAKEFLENGYDDFTFQFLAEHPECFSRALLTKKATRNPSPYELEKATFAYFGNAKSAMKHRAEILGIALNSDNFLEVIQKETETSSDTKDCKKIGALKDKNVSTQNIDMQNTNVQNIDTKSTDEQNPNTQDIDRQKNENTNIQNVNFRNIDTQTINLHSIDAKNTQKEEKNRKESFKTQKDFGL